MCEVSGFNKPKTALLLTGIQIVLLWPIWHWLWRRSLLQRERPLQWLAVVAVILLYIYILKKRRRQSPESSTKTSGNPSANLKRTTASHGYWQLAMPLVLTLAFHLFIGRIPMILCSVIGMVALAQSLSILWCSMPFHIGIFGLLCSTFRTIPTLNKCFGYPMRLLVTVISEQLLNLAGLDARRVGTGLIWSHHEIFVDGPCSGITMLWTGLFFTFALSLIYFLPQRKILLALCGATVALIGGNIFRVIGLFLIECKLIDTPLLSHNLIGSAAYLLSCFLILIMVRKLASIKPNLSTPLPTGGNGITMGKTTNTKNTENQSPAISNTYLPIATGLAVVIFIALAMNSPFLKKAEIPPEKNIVDWPTHLYDEPLVRTELSPFETTSFRHFPGDVARFETDKYRIIIYFMTEVTRELHSRALCLEAAGFKVRLKEGFTDTNDHRWSTLTAEKKINDTALLVTFKEITFDSSGKSFSELSEWYWSVFLGKTKGPWFHYSLEEKKH